MNKTLDSNQTAPVTTQIDPITTEIVRNAFIAAALDMNANLIRSAHSPVIYEMKDCSVGIFDREANLLGQAAGLPIFLGNLEVTIKLTIEKYGYEGIRNGDVFMLNDSYLTGTHLADITVISPIFLDGILVGFTASRAHWLDIGAKDPITTDSTEIYQEGLRLPPIRIIAAGVLQTDIIDILKLNSRLPAILEGDLNAQIVAARTGEHRFQEILRRFGRETVEAAAREIFAQDAHLDREAVAAVPDGEYYAEGVLDSDGHNPGTVPVKLKVTIEGSSITMDLSGSSPIVQGNVNVGRAQSISGCRVAFKMLFNPHVPVTGGTFDPLSVIIEDGTIFAAENPAACNAYSSALGLVIDLLAAALAPVIPERVAAGHFGDVMLVGLIARGKNHRIHIQANAGGWGAAAGMDGESGLINNVNGGLKSIPCEVAESVFPMRIERYALRDDSGGAGQWRGGLGTVKEYVALADNAEISLHLNRSALPGWGLLGGESGQPPRGTLIFPDGSTEFLMRANSRPVPTGTRLVVETGGGGGYGPVEDRDPDAIARDLKEGYISREAARTIYGYDG